AARAAPSAILSDLFGLRHVLDCTRTRTAQSAICNLQSAIALGVGQLMVLELLAQHLLVELADAGLGHALDKDHFVGELPLRHSAAAELQDLSRRTRIGEV